MNEEQQEKNSVLARVTRVDNETHQFIVEYGEGNHIYRVPQMPYQWNQPQPETIYCTVEEQDNGSVYLQQDYEHIFFEHYRIGQVIPFTIRQTFAEFYNLQDDLGFSARLSRSVLPESKPLQRVWCRLNGVNGKYVKVILVNASPEESRLPLTAGAVARLFGPTEWDSLSLATLLTSDTDDSVFDACCHDLIARLTSNFKDEALEQMLSRIKEHCLNVLQESDMLSNLPSQWRPLMEKRFTSFIEQTGYYLQAMQILLHTNRGYEQVTAHDHVTRLLRYLSTSGYVYHYRSRFCVMQFLFLQDKALMEHFMPDIIRLLSTSDISIFRREPYGQLWIALLEYYIREVYKNADALSGNELCREMIQVLVLQQNLAANSDSPLFDSVVNRSRLYRLCVRMNVSEPRKLLEESFYALVSDQRGPALTSVDLSDPVRSANIIANQLPDAPTTAPDPACFSTEKARLLIKDGKISLSAPGVNAQNVWKPLANHLSLWHGLQVSLREKPAADLRAGRSETIVYYRRLWDFIYKSFFSDKHAKGRTSAKRLFPGEEVDVIVTRQLEGLKFDCRIITDGYEDIHGVIDAAKDIVPYYPGSLNISDFMLNGYPLILPVEVKGIDDGHYVFSMSTFVQDYMEDYCTETLNYNSRLICMLNNPTPGATRVPAISTEGLSVSVGVEKGSSIASLQKGMIVEVGQPQQGPKPFINAVYLKQSDEFTNFSVSHAFHRLMIHYAGEEVYKDEQSDVADDAVLMDAAHVEELMNVIEDYSGTEDNYLKTYNYLSFCHLLARILGGARTEHYEQRLRLIELLNDFAHNNAFTDESNRELLQADLASLFPTESPLYEEYRKMQLVSWLDTEEHNDDLYAVSTDRAHPLLQQLASLVLSHNFVKQSGLLPQADEILDKIRALLKLRRNDTDKKFYGHETYNTEFKTSIVYPENTMRANLGEQTKKILSEICAFLNADGGTLYLGVNDQGYEFGLEEDLKYPSFNGNADHYEDYVNNQVAMQLSQEAAHHVRTRYDEGVRQKVLIIDITPSPDPISLDGVYYERMGKSSRRVQADYLQVFLASRRKWAVEHNEMTLEEAQALQPIAPPAPVETVKEPEKPAVKKIQTSRLRNNVLREYEETDQQKYLPAIGYICFIDHDKYKIIDFDDYMTDDYVLELAVHEEEEDAWLVMVYANAHIVRTSVKELLDRNKNHEFRRYAGSELIYATIAHDDDFLCMGYMDGKQNHRVRFDSISSLEEENMQDDGVTVTDVTNLGLHYVEVVPKSLLPAWVQVNPSRKELGIVLKTVNGRELCQLLPGCN